MNEVTLNGNTIEIPVKYLLKKFKKVSGYKKAKELYGVDNLQEYISYDADSYICGTIDQIADKVSGCRFRYPESRNVHAAFREVAPFMIKSTCDDNGFIFDWLKRPYAEIFTEDVLDNTKTRIRILKLILMVNPSAVLRIKLIPIDN